MAVIFKQFLDLASAQAKTIFIVFGGSLALLIWNWFASGTELSLAKEGHFTALFVCICSGGMLTFLVLWNATVFIWGEWVGPWRRSREKKKAETQRRQQLLNLSLEELIFLSLRLAKNVQEFHIPNPNDSTVISLETKGLLCTTLAGRMWNPNVNTNNPCPPDPPPNFAIPEPVWQTMRRLSELRIDDPDGLIAVIDKKGSLDEMKRYLSSSHPAVADH